MKLLSMSVNLFEIFELREASNVQRQLGQAQNVRDKKKKMRKGLLMLPVVEHIFFQQR